MAVRNRSLRMDYRGGNGSDSLPSTPLSDAARSVDGAEDDLLFGCEANLAMARDAKGREDWKTSLSCLESAASGALSAAQVISARSRKAAMVTAKNVQPVNPGAIDIDLVLAVLNLLEDCYAPDYDDEPAPEQTPDNDESPKLRNRYRQDDE